MHLDFVGPDRRFLSTPEVRALAELAWNRAYVLNLNEVGSGLLHKLAKMFDSGSTEIMVRTQNDKRVPILQG